MERKIRDINIDNLEKAARVLQKLSKNQRDEAKRRLEELGTKALRYSLGEQYNLVIEIDDTRKRPQVFLYIKDKISGTYTDPLEENGGGVVDIISVALSLIILQSQDPVIDGPIFIDEPFKMVSEEYVPMLAEFLSKIKEDFGRQIILITHNRFLAESSNTIIQL